MATRSTIGTFGMLMPFFSLAMLAPNRQTTFRWAVGFHITAVAAAVLPMYYRNTTTDATFLGHLLVVAGIVEGAALIGWRLTQLPKSQALEFLLISPLQPWRVLLAEASVGLVRLALVTLSGLPLLLLLLFTGHPPANPTGFNTPTSGFMLSDILWLLVLPYTIGALTGLWLTSWAYEPLILRRVGEIIAGIGILFYLVVGVLAAEKLGAWIGALPAGVKDVTKQMVLLMRDYNPFSALENWLLLNDPNEPAGTRLLVLQVFAMGAVIFCLFRSASRLKGHFHDRHYRPAQEVTADPAGGVSDSRPLSWWAVRRVMEYSGRSNLYLAGGVSLLYAAFIIMGDQWPSWLGRGVFVIFEQMGGVAGLTTALVILAAVPAAFQYGLWDTSIQNRCKRLELLLLTHLDADDYWDAAWSAAVRRGAGYFVIAGFLWLAACIAGRASLLAISASAAAAIILIGLYFTIGYRSFAKGTQANGLGSILTLGLPMWAFAAYQMGLPWLAWLVPPGAVYGAVVDGPGWLWALGPISAGIYTLYLAREARRTCDSDLRNWYDRNQGNKSLL